MSTRAARGDTRWTRALCVGAVAALAAACAPDARSRASAGARSGAATQSSTLGASATTADTTAGPIPTWLPGTWAREYITRHGVVGESLTVRYVQASRAFGDVRIPATRPAFRGAASLHDLSEAQLRLLARQKGFAGFTTARGRVVTWHHEIDFQPDTSPDASFLDQQDGAHILETGLDSSFVERYARLASADGRFLAVRVTRNGRVERLLVVSGDRFFYARNRTRDLPPAESLDSLIARTRPARAALIAWLDCELSAGQVAGGGAPWMVERSTLPWREGRALTVVDSIGVDAAGALRFPVMPGERWEITQQTLTSAQLRTLFRSSH